MKKIICLLAILFGVGTSFAAEVWISSFTNTADTTKNLCTGRRGFLHGVCVSSATAGTFTVYNSSAAAVNPVAVIDTSSKGCYYYDVVTTTVTKGLTYTNSATASVTTMYNCY